MKTVSKQKMKEIKAKFAKIKSQKPRAEKLIKPPLEPRYDEVFFKGLAYLDSLVFGDSEDIKQRGYVDEFQKEI